MASIEKAEDVEKGAMEEQQIKEVEKDTAVASSEGATEVTTEDAATKAKTDQDVVFIQDTGFTVKVVSPNLEPFDIQVGSLEITNVTWFRLFRF